MPILDAKDPQSWQIGFEDGVKFCAKLFKITALSQNPLFPIDQGTCEHAWDSQMYMCNPPKRICIKCGYLESVK